MKWLILIFLLLIVVGSSLLLVSTTPQVVDEPTTITYKTVYLSQVTPVTKCYDIPPVQVN